MSPALAFVGISVVLSWGLASVGLIAAGIIMLFFPGETPTASGSTFPGIVLLVSGVISLGLVQMTVAPLLGIDPPFPIKAKTIIPHARLKRWASAGRLRDFVDGMPKEVRIRAQRVVIVRQGDTAYALRALCSHARLPLAGIAGLVKAEPVRDDCIMCPFHGARFELETGKVVRQPFATEFNDQHPFLGKFQSKLLFFNKHAEDTQTYPVRIEDGEVMVCLPR